MAYSKLNSSFPFLILFVVVLRPSNISGHIRKDTDRLVTVLTHGDFIVLPHWNTRLRAPFPAIRLSHIILTTSSCLILIMPSAKLGSNKYQF